MLVFQNVHFMMMSSMSVHHPSLSELFVPVQLEVVSLLPHFFNCPEVMTMVMYHLLLGQFFASMPEEVPCSG